MASVRCSHFVYVPLGSWACKKSNYLEATTLENYIEIERDALAIPIYNSSSIPSPGVIYVSESALSFQDAPAMSSRAEMGLFWVSPSQTADSCKVNTLSFLVTKFWMVC